MKVNTKMRKVIALLLMAIWTVTILYVLCGPHLASIQTRMEQVRQVRSQWPSVPGTILDVRFNGAVDDNDYSSLLVKFQYSLSGVSYFAWQKWADYAEGYREFAEKAGTFNRGQPVTVYYDTTDPRKAVIDRRNVDLYEVSAVWETILRIFSYPSIIIGCMLIWLLVTQVRQTSRA